MGTKKQTQERMTDMGEQLAKLGLGTSERRATWHFAREDTDFKQEMDRMGVKPIGEED